MGSPNSNREPDPASGPVCEPDEDLDSIVAEIRAHLARQQPAPTAIPFRRDQEIAGELPSLRLGEELHFGPGGNGLPYLRAGWSGPEQSFTWSDGDISELVLPVPDIVGDLSLRFRAEAFLVPGMSSQAIQVRVTGFLAAILLIGSLRDYHVLVFDHHLRGRKVLPLQLHIGQPLSPRSFGSSNDSRRLGLALHALTIDKLIRD